MAGFLWGKSYAAKAPWDSMGVPGVAVSEELLSDRGPGGFTLTEVPIHFAREADHFPNAYIDVDVGATRLRLPIDTGHGLGGILLSPSVLSRLSPQYTGVTQENYDSFGERYDSRQFLLPSVAVGDLRLEQVMGFELFTRWGTPGSIGLPFLRQFNVLIDYPNRTFGLYSKHTLPGYLASQAWVRVGLVSQSAGLMLPLEVEGCDETFRLCLDTGAAYMDREGVFHNLVCSQSLLWGLLQRAEAVNPCSGDVEVLGRFQTSRLRTVDGYVLAHLGFVAVDLEYLKFDGLLGHSFFTRYSVFLSFSTDEVYLRLRDDACNSVGE